MRASFLISIGALALSACGGDSSASRTDVMAALAADVAVPAFTDVRNTVGDLDTAVQSACRFPERPSFHGIAEAVDTARTAWYESEAVWIGPVMDRRSSGVVDWPINTEEIVELMSESKRGELTDEYLGRSVGADNRGFGAIELVASSPPELDGIDPVVVCEYLRGLVAVVVTEVDLVLSDWTTSYLDGDPYSVVLAGGDSGDGVDEQVDMLVNDSLGTLESMRDDAQAPTPAVQSARLRGLVRLYAGDGEAEGLSSLLGDDLAERLSGVLAAAAEAYDAGDVASGAAAATDAQRTVATEVVARLGVTVGFSDADGDSGG